MTSKKRLENGPTNVHNKFILKEFARLRPLPRLNKQPQKPHLVKPIKEIMIFSSRAASAVEKIYLDDMHACDVSHSIDESVVED